MLKKLQAWDKVQDLCVCVCVCVSICVMGFFSACLYLCNRVCVCVFSCVCVYYMHTLTLTCAPLWTAKQRRPCQTGLSLIIHMWRCNMSCDGVVSEPPLWCGVADRRGRQPWTQAVSYLPSFLLLVVTYLGSISVYRIYLYTEFCNQRGGEGVHTQ